MITSSPNWKIIYWFCTNTLHNSILFSFIFPLSFSLKGKHFGSYLLPTFLKKNILSLTVYKTSNDQDKPDYLLLICPGDLLYHINKRVFAACSPVFAVENYVSPIKLLLIYSLSDSWSANAFWALKYNSTPLSYSIVYWNQLQQMI